MGVAEGPSWTGFYLHRTNSSVVDAPSPPAAILYNDLQVGSMSAAESVADIWSFMHSSSRIAAARSLRGKEAQGLIDLIDQVRGA